MLLNGLAECMEVTRNPLGAKPRVALKISFVQIVLLTSRANRVHTGRYVSGAAEAATQDGKAARS